MLYTYMEQHSVLPIFLFFLLFILNFIPILPFSPTTSQTTLDPKQLRALQSLNLPTSTDPCSNPPSLNDAIICDNSQPFRHLISLHLVNSPDDLSLSFTALKSLHTLQELSFINCPTTTTDTNRFPVDLASNLESFTCINSLGKLSFDMISQLENVINITISSIPIINDNGPHDIVLTNLKKLTKLTMSHANLTGSFPNSWSININHIDLSHNKLNGTVNNSLTELENLVSLDLSSNKLTGELPSSLGDLIGLKNLSLSTNSLSGSLPESMASMPELEHLDLSSNHFNGTIPKFLTNLRRLKYLNLENNNFEGVMPFNETFIKSLEVFKISDNVNLCYNHTSTSLKVKHGIAPCDKNGMPISASTKAVSSDDDDDSDDYSDEDSDTQDETSEKSNRHESNHGPNKVLVGLAIIIASIVLLIIFLVIVARKCV